MAEAVPSVEVAPKISLTRRAELLKGVPAFETLAPGALTHLARLLKESRYEDDAIIVSEGEAGETLFLIAEGRVEVSAKAATGMIPLSALERGEIFGEIALLAPGALRQATVTALGPVEVLRLAREDFDRLLEEHEEIGNALKEAAEYMLVAKFLKQASPFARLEPEKLRWLAGRLEPVSYEAGEAIILEGEAGSSCYLLRSGRAEVITVDGTKPKRLATLGAGTLFGEAALLTGDHRNATVRAIEPCHLLALRRSDLLEAMGADRAVGVQMIEMLSMRDRPRRVESVTRHDRVTADGETITILKNPARGTYYRLSAHGLFIWERLDGGHGIRDIALDYMGRFKSFAPGAISQTVLGLAAAGFIETKTLRADVVAAATRPTTWQRMVGVARRVLEWEVFINNIDPFITRLYNSCFRFILTRPAQIFLASIAVTGLIAFAWTASRAGSLLRQVPAHQLLPAMVVTYLISIVLHETSHALTAKRFGCEVRRAGFGWYWFGPVAFVDTSDMWMCDRWPRIFVSLAGPYTNIILGGVASIISVFVSGALLTATLWQFALVSYLIVLFNLNPLMEYDGYYVMMDWLERPNLRSRTLAWLGTGLPKALRKKQGLKGHGFELLYGVSSLIYVLLMGATTLVSYRLVVEQYMARVLSGAVAAWMAWAFAAIVITLCLIMMIGEMRGSRTHTSNA